MSRIPVEVLSKLSTFDVEIQGIEVKANVADQAGVVEKHLPDLISHINLTTQGPSSHGCRVVGVDKKRGTYEDTAITYRGDTRQVTTVAQILVIYARNRCMIIFLDYVGDLPESFLNFLKDPNICFVGPERLAFVAGKSCNFSCQEVGVSAGDLVARFMKKPAITNSSLADIARECEVKYVSPQKDCVEVDKRNPTVLTEEQVKFLINDAYACYQIGSKVFSSLGL